MNLHPLMFVVAERTTEERLDELCTVHPKERLSLSHAVAWEDIEDTVLSEIS